MRYSGVRDRCCGLISKKVTNRSQRSVVSKPAGNKGTNVRFARQQRIDFLFLVVALTSFSAAITDHEYVATFETDTSVRAKIDALATPALRLELDGGPHSIVVTGSCGVAGRRYPTIIIQVIS